MVNGAFRVTEEPKETVYTACDSHGIDGRRLQHHDGKVVKPLLDPMGKREPLKKFI